MAENMEKVQRLFLSQQEVLLALVKAVGYLAQEVDRPDLIIQLQESLDIATHELGMLDG